MKLFIPTDRVGLGSFQASSISTFAAMNELLRNGVEIGWHTSGLRLSKTDLWPEGHYYQSGFSTADTADTRALLDRFGLRYTPTDELPSPDRTPRAISIALYDGRGAGAEFSAPLAEILQAAGFSFVYISDEDIRSGKLLEHDVFLVPGSPDAGECYYAGLGDFGYEQVREFVAERGHYMGVCGGAYFPLTSYQKTNPYWLDIVEATDTEDLDFWRTGSGFVRCRVDDDTHPVFSGVALGSSTSLNLVYWEGPAITIKGGNIRPLAHFEALTATARGELRPTWDMQDNAMAKEAALTYYNPLTEELFDRLLRGKTAIAEAEYGKHKLLLYSPHPEMGNTGYGPRKDSISFLLLFNGLFYLSAD